MSMSDYFDPQAGARRYGYEHGHLQGKQEGLRQGEQAGYDQGFHAGHQAGWDEAVAHGNEQMQRQLEYTRQHIADKEALLAQVEEQRRLIEQLSQRLDEMDRENATLKQANEGLREVVSALKAANEQLQNDVAKIDEKLRRQTEEYTRQLWQHNRNMVFMNSVRSVLEELTTGTDARSVEVRELFAKSYSKQISSALQKGTIRVPLDQDEEFARALPNTRRFIMDMLNSVANRSSAHPERQAAESSEDHSLGF